MRNRESLEKFRGPNVKRDTQRGPSFSQFVGSFHAFNVSWPFSRGDRGPSITFHHMNFFSLGRPDHKSSHLFTKVIMNLRSPPGMKNPLYWVRSAVSGRG